jgi:CRISPR-associated endoribonuclease Cas2
MHGDASLFLVAYDSSSRQRRARIRSFLKETAVGNQRSVYELFLRASERRDLLQQISVATEAEDQLLVCIIDPRSAVLTWGRARKPEALEAVILS